MNRFSKVGDNLNGEKQIICKMNLRSLYYLKIKLAAESFQLHIYMRHFKLKLFTNESYIQVEKSNIVIIKKTMTCA